MERLKTPRGNRMVINEAWRKVRKDREIVKRHNGYDIYNEDYWRLTERIKVELSIGEKRRKGIINDEMLEKIIKRYEMEKEKIIFFTEGSKTSKGKAVGAPMVQEGEKDGYYFSMDKRCTIFTAEACAIAKGIQKWIIDKDNIKGKENLKIISDSLSVLKNISNNIISVYRMRKKYGNP